MDARVVTFQRSPARLDEAARRFQEEVAALMRQQAGFQRAFELADRESGTQLGVSLWDTDAHAAAAMAALSPIRDRSARELGDPAPSTTEAFEAVVQAAGPGATGATADGPLVAWVVRNQRSPEQLAAFIDAFRAVVVPVGQQQPGARQGYLAVDRGSGRSIAIVLRQSREALDQAGPALARAAEQLRARAPIQAPPTVAVYEVVAQA